MPNNTVVDSCCLFMVMMVWQVWLLHLSIVGVDLLMFILMCYWHQGWHKRYCIISISSCQSYDADNILTKYVVSICYVIVQLRFIHKLCFAIH